MFFASSAVLEFTFGLHAWGNVVLALDLQFLSVFITISHFVWLEMLEEESLDLTERTPTLRLIDEQTLQVSTEIFSRQSSQAYYIPYNFFIICQKEVFGHVLKCI